MARIKMHWEGAKCIEKIPIFVPELDEESIIRFR